MRKGIAYLMVMVLLVMAGTRPARAADAVVGTGSPASCDEAAFDAALAVVQASPKGAITFDCGPGNHTIEIFSSANIIKDVAIDGDGKIRLFAQGSSPGFVKPRFFEVSGGGTLILHNIILEGGRGPAGDGWGSQGGSIVVWGSSILDMQNSTILNSASTAWGGAIANEGGAVRVQNSLISGSAKWGGAYSGANGYDVFINATVVNSTSQLGGGGLRFWNTLRSTITDSNITDNTTSGAGGGIENIGGNLEIAGSYIERNSATQWGGGLKNSNNGDRIATATIVNSRIAENQSAANGGGVDNNGTLVIVNTNVTDNGAKLGGGILNWGGQLTLETVAVTRNAADYGGGLYVHGGGAKINNAQIAENLAAFDGGGLFLTEIAGANADNWVAIAGTDILDNQANQAGSGIVANRAYLTIDETEIAGNNATAIYLWETASGGSYASITQSSIHDNGAGVYNGENSTLLLFNTTISQNGEWGVWSGLDSIYTHLSFSTVRGNTDGQVKRTGGRLALDATAIDRGVSANPNCFTEVGLPALEGAGSWSNDNTCGAPVMVSDGFNLGPLAPNGGPTPNHLPGAGSVLIDAVGCETTTVDQRGALRPQGAACDVGAVEVGAIGYRTLVPMVVR